LPDLNPDRHQGPADRDRIRSRVWIHNYPFYPKETLNHTVQYGTFSKNFQFEYNVKNIENNNSYIDEKRKNNVPVDRQ
jgi:hypothetical protein